jgi:hypothetical protein
MGYLSFVLGILALIGHLCFFLTDGTLRWLFYLTLLLSLLSLIVGAFSRKERLAFWGMVAGTLGVLVWLFLLFYLVVPM